jgi:hypothetical protein
MPPSFPHNDRALLCLQSGRPLEVCEAKSERSEECGTAKSNANDQTLAETRYVSLKHSLQELFRNHSLELGSTSVQDDLGIEAGRRDGELLEERVLEGGLGSRDTESATEGLNDYSGC